MNKKRLSVVMAGAMLASSVAPVLAAEEVAVTEVQKGTLINELTDKLWDAPRFSSDKRVDADLKGKSIYAISIDGEINTAISAKTLKDTNVKSDLQSAIQTLINNLKVGDKVELVNLGSREVVEDGKTLVLSTNSTSKYTESELSNTAGDTVHKSLYDLFNGTTGTLKGTDVVDRDNSGYVAGKGYVVKLTTNAANTFGEKEIVLTTNTDRLDFTQYNSTDGSEKKLVADTAVKDFNGFLKADSKNVDIANTVEKSYKIASDGTTLSLSDLFDGVMLTEKGQALLNEAKDTKYVVEAKEATANDAAIVKSGTETDIEKAINALTADKNGVYKLKLEIANADRVAEAIGNTKTWTQNDNQYNVYYITGTSKAELKKVLKWIDQLSADVDVLAGEDRYTTAVKIAKEVAKLETVGNNGNIVLVNGNSLVDGLAAAPLANFKGNGAAPILLTESNKLPSATKKYLTDLVDVAGNNTVTVNIVGGTGVVSKAVERELKDLNLKVERFGGEDREATSMAVAEEIGFDNGAYVVGAKGEADAMSIAGYAASRKAPIVVSGFGGLSEDTLEELEGARVNVIGGENAVSAKDYASIKDVALTLARVSGEDRKATNAAVINRFYTGNFAGNTKSVIVAKDDVLIDALTSSNLSAKENAPIVLGTKSLSEAQIDAIAKNANKAKKVYQVGYGVERSVVKTVAQALGLI